MRGVEVWGAAWVPCAVMGFGCSEWCFRFLGVMAVPTAEHGCVLLAKQGWAWEKQSPVAPCINPP